MLRLRFSSLLLCSTAIISTPVMADASLDELKAKLEKAEKENIILKTEKLERENITMKLEKIESENAALRNEMKVDKTPTASVPSQKTATAPANPPSPEAKSLARRAPVETSVPTPREHIAARKEINHALDNIPKDDTRREMTASYKAPKEEVPVVVKQWQGVYAGINGGYGYGSQYSSGMSYGTQYNYNVSGATEPATQYLYGSGWYNGGLAGGQFGYNHQFVNNLIVGGELDVDWADINTNNSGGNGNVGLYQAGATRSYLFSVNGRTGVDWLGTVRGRLGYNLGNFMPYITGGLSYGGLASNATQVNASYNNYYSSPTSYYTSYWGNGNYAHGSSVSLGWVAGAGAELMVAPNWSLKGEYLYTQLSSFNSYNTAVTPQSLSGVGYTNYAAVPTMIGTGHLSPFGVHQARVGLNYHTGWLGGGTPTVTAKY